MSMGNSIARRAGNLREVEIVQNAALGAYLLWRMGAAYQDANGASARMELYFCVLPILLHRPTLDVARSTNAASGLSLFVSKMHQEEDELLAIHNRAIKLRNLTLQSINVGVAAGLLVVDHKSATVCALDVGRPARLPQRLTPMKRTAEKLGQWFGSLPVSQVLAMLRVVS